MVRKRKLKAFPEREWPSCLDLLVCPAFRLQSLLLHMYQLGEQWVMWEILLEVAGVIVVEKVDRV